MNNDTCIYVVDIDRRPKDTGNDSDDVFIDMIYVHRDMLRGCTQYWFRMKQYYDYLEMLTKGLFDIRVSAYPVTTNGAELKEEDISDDLLKTLALTWYNDSIMKSIESGEYRDPHWQIMRHIPTVATMPIITNQPLWTGEPFITTSAIMQSFNLQYYSSAEYDTIMKIMYLFTELNNYIIPFKKDKDIISLREKIMDAFPEFMVDYYQPYQTITFDPAMLTKIWLEEYGFMY